MLILPSIARVYSAKDSAGLKNLCERTQIADHIRACQYRLQQWFTRSTKPTISWTLFGVHPSRVIVVSVQVAPTEVTPEQVDK